MAVFIVQRNTDDEILGVFSDLDMARAYVSVQLPLQRRDLPQKTFCIVDTAVLPFRETWNGYCILGMDVIESFSVGEAVVKRHADAVAAINGERAMQAQMEKLI